MKYWFKNVADNIYIYPKSTPRNLILQTRTSDCNSANKKQYVLFLSNLLKDRSYVQLTYMTGILPIAKYSSGSELNMFWEYTMAS